MKTKTNQERFLAAANWALLHEREGRDVGINIRRMSIDGRRNVAIFNGSKTLMYSGYAYPEQEQLKGLIVEEQDGIAVRLLAGCFPKFYNYGEPSEGERYREFLPDPIGQGKRRVDRDLAVYFYVKEDGTNIRPYWNPASNRVEFATRSMLTGFTDEDFNFNFGEAARRIAKEKYPALLDKNFVSEFSLVFELIHPDSRIITNYGDTKDLVLLAGFDLIEDCRELPRWELEKLRETDGFNLSKYYLMVSNTQFDEALETLPSLWAGTDQEGTVATFIRTSTGEPLYRLKIKNKEYLEMLRLSRYCTLKRTRELIETHGLTSWKEVRDRLYEAPSMNEELEMAYKVHYDRYHAWQKDLDKYLVSLWSLYNTIPEGLDQKAFALHVLGNHALKRVSGAMFEMRKLRAQGITHSSKLREIAEKHIPLGEEEEKDAA